MATPAEIRNQIRTIETKCNQDVAALKKELALSESGFQVGQTLKSKHNQDILKVTGSTDKGVTGRLTRDYLITPDKFKDWAVMPEATGNGQR